MAYKPKWEIEEFWKREVEPTVKGLINGKCPFPEIQQRYSYLMQTIEVKNGRVPDIKMHDEESPDKAPQEFLLMIGCRMNNGQPEVALFVPALKTAWKDMKEKNFIGFRQRFQLAILVGLIHELDHANLGFVEMVATMEEVIHAESIVWASTCEYAIRPLIDNHHLELCRSNQMYYSNWVACGRNPKNPAWIRFIASLYVNVRKA